MSRWFRHYAGMMRDEKLVRAAMRSKQAVERVVWVWGAILESASEVNDGGRFEIDPLEAAYFLRCDEADINSVIFALEALGRLHEGVVVQWAERQFESDTSRERQKRYRDRKKSSLQSDGDVTLPSRDGKVTLQETETDSSDANASGAASPADPRDDLWTNGVSILKAITGKTEGASRSMIGKWLKDAKDDCALVLGKIQTAQRERIGDPVSWITAALKPPDKPPKKVTHASMWNEEAIAFGIIDEPASTQDRRLDAGLARGPDQGTGYARRIASA